MNPKIWIILVAVIILVVFLPPLVIGEVMYNWKRTKKYDDLEGFTSLRLITEDEVEIQAWYTNTSSKLLIVVHGHADNSAIMYDWYGDIFQQIGYDLLFVDLRNHGRSEIDRPVALGVYASMDIKSTLAWVHTQHWQEVVIFGTSMGSIATIIGISEVEEKMRPDKIILDSTFTRPVKVIDNNLATHHIPKFYRTMTIEYLLTRRYDNFNFPGIIDILISLDIPMLGLHGSSDDVAPLEVVEELTNELDSIDYVIIEDGTHSRLFRHEEFGDAVSQFLEVEING